MKSYTNLEQSKKLAKILPLESADMYYPWYIEEDGDTIESGHRVSIPSVGNLTTHKVNKRILPCWSLAALLDVLPNGINVIKDKSDTENEKYMCTVEGTNDIITTFGNNPVDACVAMIEKLNELKML